jgi:hypothetical protein
MNSGSKRWLPSSHLMGYMEATESLKYTYLITRDTSPSRAVSYGPSWAHYLGGYQDPLLGGPLGLPDLRCTASADVKHKDYRGEVLS